jgi:N12 class adenine-specific DNA methylase
MPVTRFAEFVVVVDLIAMTRTIADVYSNPIAASL